MKIRIGTWTLLGNWKKLWNMQVTIISILIGALGTVTKGTGGHGSWRTNGNHPNYYIIANGQNTEKRPGDLRRLAITQTPVKDDQLTLMWKTLIYHYYYYYYYYYYIIERAPIKSDVNFRKKWNNNNYQRKNWLYAKEYKVCVIYWQIYNIWLHILMLKLKKI